MDRMRTKVTFLLVSLFLSATGFHDDGSEAKRTAIEWYGMQEAQELASAGEKKVMVYAEASWCTYCKKMEKEVFPLQQIQATISEFFYPVRVDIESDNILTFNGRQMTEMEFARTMRVSGTPTFLFVNGAGEVLGGQPGFIPADVFKALLTYIGSDAHARVSFNQFYEKEYSN